jgi:uncharacterized protein YdaU (DUF1376 family)
MAKDPAFLFYPGDFCTGTQFFSDEQVGKYMRLLMAQHQHGHLTENQVIFICKSYDKDVMSKFMKDSNGLWYNERLEIEMQKRKSYVESRSKNKEGKTKAKIISSSYDSHMENKDRNKDVDDIEFKIEQALNEIYVDQERPKWGHLDFEFELETFRNKVRGSPHEYRSRDSSGIRLAFQYQLRNSKGKPKNGTSKDKSTVHVGNLMEGVKRRYGGTTG